MRSTGVGQEVKHMASVIRLNPGGGTAVEKIGVSLEQAKEWAARLAEAGEPPGCAWCVGLEEEEEVEAKNKVPTILA